MGTFWYGGTIYTMQDEGHMVESVFSDGGRIIAAGEAEKILAQFQEQITDKINLEGKIMLPGLVDSHMHLIGHGESLIRLDLTKCKSKAAVFEAVQDYSSELEAGEWLVGEGWNENNWDNPEMIHCAELDALIPDNPVVLKRVCRHAMAVNTRALELAGISEKKVNPEGGIIEKDDSGNLTGVLKDQAQELIYSVMPNVQEQYLQKSLRAAIKSAYTKGLTGAHTEDLNYYGGFLHTYNTFKKVIEEEGLRFRAHLLVHHEVMEDFEQVNGQYQSGSEWVEFGAIKMFADGALGGRTALLSHPYADDPETSGIAIHSQEELNYIVWKARMMNMPVAIHTIGDLAFEMAVQAIETHPLNGKGRDRLIHAQILRRELIDRIKGLPLILDIQPVFVASDFPWVIDRVGEENMEVCYAWKTLLQEGIHCAGGSDAPIESADPLLGIHAAVTRTNLQNKKEVFKPLEAISVFEAISLYTKGSAYAINQENDKGLIKEGYYADFTIIDKDIFKVEPHSIPDIKVEMTVIGEKVVYRRYPS